MGIYNSADWRCYTSINSNIQGQTFAFYKKVTGGVVPPSITANNVEIEFDATGGSIAYSINNGVEGGSISATTTSDWLTLGNDFTSPIAFTCSANEAAAARTATVTLTYTYNNSETVTKDVTVTQAGAPVAYTTIPELFAAATSTETSVFVTFNNWVVSGVSINGKNVFVTDNAGNGFVIYSSDDMSETYSVGNVLSGTAVSCTLKKYNGFAELINVDANDLTITAGGTVSTASIAMADLAGVNTGALLHYDNLTCSVSDNKYYLSDGNNNTLQVYNAIYAFEALEDGKTYNITGIYQQYNNTKEILPRSAADIEEVVSAEPSVTVTSATLNVDANEHEGTLALSYENLTITSMDDFSIQHYNAQGEEIEEPVWIEVLVAEQDPTIGEGYVVSYYMPENDGEARTAYFKVYAMDDETNLVYSNLVTVNQAAYVPPVQTENYELFSGNLVEGDYIIYYNGYAMKNTVSNSRLQYEEVEPDNNDVISTDDASIVWHIAQSGDYWTIYSADANAYAAGNGNKNQAQMLSDGTDDKSLWTVSGSSTYEFVNKYNDAQNVNKNLRNNGTNGFACYSTSTGGALSLYKKADVKYAVNLNQPQNNEGTIAADKETAAEGETVTLTATPNTGYAFDSWTVLDGGANEVTVTNNTFIMPANYVEVEGTFTALSKHNIVIPAAIENNVIVDVTGNQAYANETVTITVEAPANKVLATLTVTGNSSNNNITIDPEVSPYVDEYTFTMPDENVTINATFDNAPSFTVSFSVNGTVDDDLEVSVTQGQSTALPTSSTQTPEGFAITGWAATNGSAEAVADPYTPTADITLFAILGQTIPHSLVINSSTPNFPTSYGTANTFTKYNLGGKNFMIQQGYINSGKLQWRASGNNNGTGTMYNSEDLGKINTIILVYDSSDGNKNFTIKAGTTENPTGGTSIEPSINGVVYTFDLSSGDYNYFVMTNGEYAGYLQSISIDYVADLNVNTITHITTSTTYTTNIPETTCVVVESGAVLTLNGTNNGTVDNLIIEDGGQLVTSNPVVATMQKNITAYSSKATPNDGWYFISSPLDGTTTSLTAIENLIPSTGNYDLYAFDQNEDKEWRNYKAHSTTFTAFNAGEGYLYANSGGQTIAFSGTVRATTAAFTKENLAYTAGNRLAGFNLVGNPFPSNATVSMPYYKMNSTSEGLNAVVNTAGGVIAPMEGVFVCATGTGQSVTFTATTASVTAAASAKGAVNLNVESEGELLDRAIVTINGTGMLGKLNLNETATKLYITQNGKDYAVVNAQAQGEMPVNFKASKDGTYTLSVNAENLEMGYLHLIDNMTGADVDLLATPSYTFEAKTTDYASRFRLVFSANEENGASTGSETFAFFNGSEWMISNQGEATLQVIDVLGRVLSSETISGTVTVSLKETAGVYMLRLVNGNDVKVQKVVVR